MALIDAYAGNVEQFPVLGRWNYLNHGGVSPLPACVADAMRQFADSFQNDGYLGEVSIGSLPRRLKQSVARLIGVDPEEIALLKNTAEAISTVAFGLVDWKPGDQIVLPNVEYPANVYPWMEAARRFELEISWVKEVDVGGGVRAVPIEAILSAAAHPRCRMVALSHVQFASGQRLDVEQIGRWCRENDRLLCVDAIQSLGALPFDARRMHADFVAAGSQKWLLGPMGAAFLYVRRELLDRVRPLAIGAYSVVDPDNYGDYRYEFPPDMRRHESGSIPIAEYAGLAAALDMLHSIGIEPIAERIRAVTDHLVARLREAGYRIISPRGDGQWSGIVSFLPAEDGGDLPPIAKRLREKKRIEIAVRENRLRAAPHFYNTIEQMDDLVAALRN